MHPHRFFGPAPACVRSCSVVEIVESTVAFDQVWLVHNARLPGWCCWGPPTAGDDGGAGRDTAPDDAVITLSDATAAIPALVACTRWVAPVESVVLASRSILLQRPSGSYLHV